MEPDTTKDRRCGDTNRPVSQENTILDRKEEMSYVSTLPRFVDDDYIEFSFREEDGAIHLIKDGNPEASEHFDRVKKCSTRRINRKLFSGEKAEEVLWESNCDHGLIEDERNIYEETNISNEKETVKPSTKSDTALPKVTPTTDNAGSGDYFQSNGSSGSFAFPVLNVEGIDSPVRMPEPNMLQLRRRHKKIWPTTCILCRRF